MDTTKRLFELKTKAAVLAHVRDIEQELQSAAGPDEAKRAELWAWALAQVGLEIYEPESDEGAAEEEDQGEDGERADDEGGGDAEDERVHDEPDGGAAQTSAAPQHLTGVTLERRAACVACKGALEAGDEVFSFVGSKGVHVYACDADECVAAVPPHYRPAPAVSSAV